VIVILSKIWLVNVTTLEILGAQSDPARSWTGSVEGAVRKYAGGRQRAVGSLGLSNVWKFTLVELTQTQCELLETWMAQGVTVLARDARGQSMYGTFFAVNRGENFGVYPYATYTAGIELNRVDVVEGV
jgi:hypothetical protein